METPLVVDFGSQSVRVGYVDEEGRHVNKSFPSGVGSFKDKVEAVTGDTLLTEVGKNGPWNFSRPIEFGFVTNWDLYEQVLRYGYDAMRVKPEDCGLLICEDALSGKGSREKIIEMAFESLHVPSAYLGKQPIFQLYNAGCTSGVVCSSGYSISHVVPVHEGHQLNHALTTVCAGGVDISQYLLQKIQHGADAELVKKWSMENFCHSTLVDQIKHSFCSVVSKENNISGFADKMQPFQLPDGKELKLGPEYSSVTELLFQPFEDATEPTHTFHQGLDLAVNTCKTITQCRETTQGDRREICAKVVLAGGNTLFHGMKERFLEELKALLPSPLNFDVSLSLAPGGLLSTWNGAALLSALSSFKNLSLLKEDYEEFGPQIVHSKFP
jgi:actin